MARIYSAQLLSAVVANGAPQVFGVPDGDTCVVRDVTCTLPPVSNSGGQLLISLSGVELVRFIWPDSYTGTLFWQGRQAISGPAGVEATTFQIGPGSPAVVISGYLLTP